MTANLSLNKFRIGDKVRAPGLKLMSTRPFAGPLDGPDINLIAIWSLTDVDPRRIYTIIYINDNDNHLTLISDDNLYVAGVHFSFVAPVSNLELLSQI